MDADTNHIAKCYADTVLTNVCHCGQVYVMYSCCRLCTFLLLFVKIAADFKDNPPHNYNYNYKHDHAFILGLFVELTFSLCLVPDSIATHLRNYVTVVLGIIFSVRYK